MIPAYRGLVTTGAGTLIALSGCRTVGGRAAKPIPPGGVPLLEPVAGDIP